MRATRGFIIIIAAACFLNPAICHAEDPGLVGLVNSTDESMSNQEKRTEDGENPNPDQKTPKDLQQTEKAGNKLLKEGVQKAKDAVAQRRTDPSAKPTTPKSNEGNPPQAGDRLTEMTGAKPGQPSAEPVTSEKNPNSEERPAPDVLTQSDLADDSKPAGANSDGGGAPAAKPAPEKNPFRTAGYEKPAGSDDPSKPAGSEGGEKQAPRGAKQVTEGAEQPAATADQAAEADPLKPDAKPEPEIDPKLKAAKENSARIAKENLAGQKGKLSPAETAQHEQMIKDIENSKTQADLDKALQRRVTFKDAKGNEYTATGKYLEETKINPKAPWKKIASAGDLAKTRPGSGREFGYDPKTNRFSKPMHPSANLPDTQKLDDPFLQRQATAVESLKNTITSQTPKLEPKEIAGNLDTLNKVKAATTQEELDKAMSNRVTFKDATGQKYTATPDYIDEVRNNPGTATKDLQNARDLSRVTQGGDEVPYDPDTGVFQNPKTEITLSEADGRKAAQKIKDRFNEDLKSGKVAQQIREGLPPEKVKQLASDMASKNTKINLPKDVRDQLGKDLATAMAKDPATRQAIIDQARQTAAPVISYKAAVKMEAVRDKLPLHGLFTEGLIQRGGAAGRANADRGVQDGAKYALDEIKAGRTPAVQPTGDSLSPYENGKGMAANQVASQLSPDAVMNSVSQRSGTQIASNSNPPLESTGSVDTNYDGTYDVKMSMSTVKSLKDAASSVYDTASDIGSSASNVASNVTSTAMDGMSKLGNWLSAGATPATTADSVAPPLVEMGTESVSAAPSPSIPPAGSGAPSPMDQIVELNPTTPASAANNAATNNPTQPPQSTDSVPPINVSLGAPQNNSP